jgi:hypothetical protein
MNRSTRGLTRALPTASLVLSTACLMLTLALASASQASAATVHFQHESMSAFEHQLAAGEIHAATFNKKAHSLHLSMNDHRHFLVSYPSHEEPQIAAKLEAKGVPVKIEKHASTTAAAKPVKHKLRYIAGGILVLIIVAIVIVLLVGRRRALDEEDEERDAHDNDDLAASTQPGSD